MTYLREENGWRETRVTYLRQQQDRDGVENRWENGGQHEALWRIQAGAVVNVHDDTVHNDGNHANQHHRYLKEQKAVWGIGGTSIRPSENSLNVCLCLILKVQTLLCIPSWLSWDFFLSFYQCCKQQSCHIFLSLPQFTDGNYFIITFSAQLANNDNAVLHAWLHFHHANVPPHY